MEVLINLKKHVDNSYRITLGSLAPLKYTQSTAIVTNETVAALHLDRLLNLITAPKVAVIKIPDGEEFKNITTLQTVLNGLFENRIDRRSTLIAFGGGIVGDVSGFAASIYQRGIDFVQIPTTLLAMVDASVGGKTGVNNSFGKNLIGAFHQPKAVYIDPFWLSTLPEREFNAGAAEIIKMAATLDSEFFEWLETGDLEGENLLEAIKRSVEIKANIVTQDEKEYELRQVLNYGHTFGHAIERESGYTKYLHGEGVAIGIVMANKLSERLGYLTQKDGLRIKKLLEKYNLPTTYRTEDADSFYESFFLDKKSKSGKITFILPRGIGDYIFVNDADRRLVLEAIKDIE
ncbi:MAG: 3-dehydroquinate synthase [Helicobacteraceae bacterium]|jgi:3-dehydroquinate synthase|nr:3-dehydroquinate synthase [Helicobacteraceae bacterium]